jgi:N-acetylmuramoyl-L-alanine amidase
VAAEALQDTALRYEADAVRQVRVGRRQGAVRVVLDLESATKVSVFTLYNPYRVVIDAARGAGARQGAVAAVTPATVASPLVMPTDETRLPDEPAPAAAAPATQPATLQVLGAVPPADETELPDRSARAAEPADPAPPAAPSRNADGTFSLARQLGLGISRIVIDPGHGGHDPGTPTAGTNEARLVLDVALRLEKLLVKDGFDVVLTRRTDVFIPLEERTAIANRERADLFLSIHANSGRDPKARGVEVYYLSFASNPEAEAVAARENTTSTGGMHNLPGIVRAIALNNKLDESRDFAQMVQQSLASRLSKTNEGMRSRGVKKAPFVVLIGAAMPSVLAEIGFITNRQEVGLIKTPAYRQKVAESLQAAVVQYQRSLKRQMSVATR